MAGSKTSETPPSVSGTSPTTSPARYSKAVASAHDYALVCDEPTKGQRRLPHHAVGRHDPARARRGASRASLAPRLRGIAQWSRRAGVVRARPDTKEQTVRPRQPRRLRSPEAHAPARVGGSQPSRQARRGQRRRLRSPADPLHKPDRPAPRPDPELVIVDITYRRQQQDSGLDRLLAWLLPAKPPHEPVDVRIDFVLGEDLGIQAGWK